MVFQASPYLYWLKLTRLKFSLALLVCIQFIKTTHECCSSMLHKCFERVCCRGILHIYVSQIFVTGILPCMLHTSHYNEHCLESDSSLKLMHIISVINKLQQNNKLLHLQQSFSKHFFIVDPFFLLLVSTCAIITVFCALRTGSS